MSSKTLLFSIGFICLASQCKKKKEVHPKPEPTVNKAYNILLIGNSHTEYCTSIPKLFNEIAKFNNKVVEVFTKVEEGTSLKILLDEENAKTINVMDSADADGNYFDFVVLQESTGIVLNEYEAYKSNLQNWQNSLKAQSPNARYLLYQSMSPYDFFTDLSTFNSVHTDIGKTMDKLLNEISNSRIYGVGKCIKEAYEKSEGYDPARSNEDQLRYGDDAMHQRNDAGFLSAVLLYYQIYNETPQIPEKLDLNNNASCGTFTQEKVSDIIPQSSSLVKIAVK